MPAGTPQTLERYELVHRIAVGGMAEVFRAKAFGAHGFEKTLAIKRILPELARDPEFEERFIGEAKLAVKLTHANVVQVFDFGRTAGTLFIAMEFVDGLDLAALLKRYRDLGERVPIPAAFQMAIEIARGLDFAHKHKVVHRDVSPSNILLSRAGEVKIADFGIALAAAERRGSSSGRRRIMGKWRYMSPEQSAGDGMSARSDIFSAASVMFEIFTGEKLFPGDEAEEIIRNIHDMKIPPASGRRTGLPPRLDEILGRALERDPERRWDKAADMLRALIEVSYESSIVASALDVSETVGAVLEEAVDTGEQGADIDHLIRAQLAAAGESAGAARKTAVGEASTGEDIARAPTQTAATMVKTGVDADGITIWESDEQTIAAGPVALRRTGQERAIVDVGPEEERNRDTGAHADRASRLGLVAIAAAGLLVAAGVGVSYFALGGGDEGDGGGTSARPVEPRPVAFAGADAAAPAVEEAVLHVGSTPPGARIRVGGELHPEPTPARVAVPPGTHEIELELDGHRLYLEQVELGPGRELILRPALIPLRAGLIVTTTPPGVTVSLDGDEIGVTPLERDDLRPGAGRTLALARKDFVSVTVEVDLVEDETTRVHRALKSAIVWGVIDLEIVDGWADVTHNGRRVGRASGRLRLPVGRQRLRLDNPVTGKSTSIDVVVHEGRVERYTARL